MDRTLPLPSLLDINFINSKCDLGQIEAHILEPIIGLTFGKCDKNTISQIIVIISIEIMIVINDVFISMSH